jgi:hypothetical protein
MKIKNSIILPNFFVGLKNVYTLTLNKNILIMYLINGSILFNDISMISSFCLMIYQ